MAAGRAARPAPAATAGHDRGLWLAVLGPLAAWRDGVPLELGPPGQATVLALLALQPGRLVGRETIIDVLWEQRPPATAAGLVQAHVSRLRRILDPGEVRLLTGDYRGASEALEESLGIYRDLGDRGAEAEVLNEAGTLHRLRNDPVRANEYHRQALEVAREITSPWDKAHALAGLGRCALAVGRVADAAAALRQALDIFQRIGAAETADVAAELENLVT